MNFIDLLKKAFMDNWTGGASIDPRTGQRGDPGRYHGRGSFDDFEYRDLFRPSRWHTEQRSSPNFNDREYDMNPDRNPKSDTPEYTSYYHPRLTGESMRSYIEDQRSGRNPRAFPLGSGPLVTDPGLQRGFQDWPGVNPQGRPYGINPGSSFDNTTRTIVQDKEGIKETVVTKTPNPKTSIMEIMERLRELQEARAR